MKNTIIKKNVKKISLSEISNNLSVSKKDILKIGDKKLKF